MRDNYSDARISPPPDPWVWIAGEEERHTVSVELLTELADGHLLAGLPTTPILRCTGCDDVVVAVGVESGWFAQVHLTWSRKPEPPPFPRCVRLTGGYLREDLLQHEH